jgi:tripartite-type tricarboxylate transporter receptor subunit TctC
MKRLIALCALALTAAGALAQPAAFHPSKPVTLIVPYSAGGGTDVVGRLFAKELSELWGQPVLVENRTGGSGVIGSAVVAKAPSDGHTLLLSVASIAINPFLMAKMPFETKTDFTPVTTLAKPVVVMVGSPDLKAGDARGFVALARAEPGKHSFASAEPSTRLYGERLAKATGIKLVHVPYKGSGQWMIDVASHVVDSGFASITSALPLMQEGKIKVLGIATAQRNPMVPNVATFREQGVSELESKSWYGLFGPGNLPQATVAAIHADVLKVLDKPEVKAKLQTLGAEPGGDAPAAFTARFQRDLVEYEELIRELGIQAE